MNRDLQAKSEQQQQQQQHDCGKHNLNFLRSYYKRKQKKQKEKTNTSKAIFDSYRDLQAKLEQQQKQQYDCGKPQNLNFFSSYQKNKTKEAHKRRRGNTTTTTTTKRFVQTLTASYRDLQAKLEQQQKQQYDCGKPQNLNFLSSYQKKKTKKTQIEEEEETQQQQQQQKPFVQTLTDSYRDLEAKLEQQKKQRHSSNRIAANIIITWTSLHS